MPPDHGSLGRYPIQPRPFQCAFPLQFKPEVAKERFRGRKIVDDDTHMIDAMDMHISHLICIESIGR